VAWERFLEQHDMVFLSLPQGWQEAPHFGNAMVGSMLYMREGALWLEVFRADVCDHRDESYGWTAYSRPHFRIGCFRLNTVGTPTGCNWRKSLWNAELTGSITTDCGEIAIRHLVHADDMAIVTELTPSPGERGFTWSWHPVEAITTRGGYPHDAASRKLFATRYGQHYLDSLRPATANPAGRLQQQDDVSIWVQDLMAGGQYATAWRELEEGETRTHIATIANSTPAADAGELAVATIQHCCSLERTAWIERHRAWWHNYYPKSYLSLPDASLEALYWQTIYRYGCCSRAGRYYVDTSGLWFQGAQWPYSTHDWNTQSAHWGVYAANRLDQGEEVVRRLHTNRQNLIDAVYPAEWRNDSAYLHLATAGDFRGSRLSDRRYYDCVGCLPWLLHNAWWQYRFSMDDQMLRDTIYPLLRRSVNLYLHLSYEEDGVMHLQPTYSPETGVYGDANFDLALFKWGCHVLLWSSKRLGIDDPLETRWQEVIDTLVAFPEDDKGFMLGAEQTAWDDHRHLSHMLMIYPLYLVNREQEGTGDVLSRSYDLADAGAGAESGGMEELVAMVQTHAGPIGTAMGEGDRALDGLKRIQSELHPNGLWSCGGNPCIESTVGLVNTIQNMLIQSWSDPALEQSGPIRIFPALPSEWRDVEFHDLRTEGAFLVSARRVGGRTVWIRIKSLAGEPCRIQTDLIDPVTEGSRDHTLVALAPNRYELDIRKGESVVLSGGVE